MDKIRIEDEVTEEVCDECGRHMVIKYGPHGKFLACPGFPSTLSSELCPMKGSAVSSC